MIVAFEPAAAYFHVFIRIDDPGRAAIAVNLHAVLPTTCTRCAASSFITRSGQEAAHYARLPPTICTGSAGEEVGLRADGPSYRVTNDAVD